MPLLTALVVEPVPSLAKLLTGLMKEVGFRVLVATSPEDALNEIDNGCFPIDIVLCECSLPYFSGPRLASFIQQQRPAMPIVLLCDEPVPEAIVRRSKAVFLEKPFTRDQLSAVLNRVAVLSPSHSCAS
jgi:DNA-binding NtrC family response regulator